jgi:hypothetical protein
MRKLLIASLIVVTLPCVALATPVPDTGQTKCYDNTQEMITCPNPGEDYYGQDAQYITNPHSYTKLDANGNDLLDNAPWPWAMVRDNVTGLIWEVKTDDGTIHDKDNTYTWERAMEFGTTLNSQNFGGYSNWHLPTIKELSGLVDSSKPSGPTINTDYFPHTLSSLHWSSIISAGNENAAWCVVFSDGSISDWIVSRDRSFMAVSGEPPTQYFSDNCDGTIIDANSGLMWQKDTAPDICAWQMALSYCENLFLAGQNEWRLPNKNELQTLVDYSRSAPSINTSFFPSTDLYYYWSSTTDAGSLGYSWGINFRYGTAYNVLWKTDRYSVRCVRGGLCGSAGDADGDTLCDNADNCPEDYNPLHIDCDDDGVGDICDANTVDPDGDGVDAACDNCTSTPNANQCDSYPPGGNGCGDACECEGNFNCSLDQDVDGSDASTFKEDFGRSTIIHPCIAGDTCNGDFNCDGDVDGTDASLFKRDFGRSSLQNPCPLCMPGQLWCVY